MKRLNIDNKTFYLRIVDKNGKVVKRVSTNKLGRFAPQIGMLRNYKGYFHVYLKVIYGKQLDNFGKMTTFDNFGWYDNFKDLNLAYNAFKDETL